MIKIVALIIGFMLGFMLGLSAKAGKMTFL